MVACGVGNELYWSVLEIGRIATYCNHAFADFLLGLVQFRLPLTSDEDIGAFFSLRALRLSSAAPTRR